MGDHNLKQQLVVILGKLKSTCFPEVFQVVLEVFIQELRELQMGPLSMLWNRRWVNIWTAQELVTMIFQYWLVRRLLNQKGEMDQIILFNIKTNFHGFQSEK